MICPLVGFQIPWSVIVAPSVEITEEETKRVFTERREKVVRGIPLFHGVKIRLASKEDIEDLNTICFDPFGPIPKYSSQTFVMVKYCKGKAYSKFEKVMKNTVLGLRLLKGGYVSEGHIFHILLLKTRRLALTSIGERHRRRFALSYALEFKEVPRLKEILKKILVMDFDKRKSLGLACKRFQRGYEEEDIEDRLIDFMIAFEALFLKGEKGGRKGNLVSIACSHLLGKDEEEREKVRSTLAEAYSVRNCIVHGSEYERTKPNDKGQYWDTLPDLVSEVENYLRESIKRLLD